MGKTKQELMKWHAYQKQKWRLQLELRRQSKLRPNKTSVDSNGQSETSRFPNIGRSITDFVQKSANSKIEKPWQILSISETLTAGIFKMWILADSEVYSVNLKITRIFYVNQIKPPEKESSLCRKANKHLPRSQVSYNLYEYSIPENLFQKNRNEIMAEFSNPNVEGVYELNVPLVFNLLIRLGCVCSLKKNTKLKDFDTFELSELEPRNEVEYLSSNVPKVLYLFIHFNSTKMIIGLFQTINNTVQVFILDSVRNLNMPNLNNLLTAEREKRLKCGISEEFLPNQNQKFDVKIEINEQKVYKALDRCLATYKDEKRGATLVLLQSNVDEVELKKNVSALNDFPLVKVNVPEKAGLFNVLDWQKVAAKHMIGHYMNSNTILANMIEQSRYFQVPIGNLPKDSSLYACDLFYARHLFKNNYVLWCSPTSVPDLGGKQFDDYRLIQNNIDTSSSVSVQVNNPGFYQNICLDIEITSLSISALLQLTRINEFEGASSVNYSVAPQTSLEQMISGDMGSAMFSSYYDEAALSLPVLRIMRTMVQYWLKDVALFENAFADLQIIHFYRWLQSPNSLLYDPAIRRTLQSYMKKLCILVLTLKFLKFDFFMLRVNFKTVFLQIIQFLVKNGILCVKKFSNSNNILKF